MKNETFSSRFLIVVGGIIVGFIAGGFGQVCDRANHYFEYFILKHRLFHNLDWSVATHYYIPAMIVPLAFVGLAYISDRYLPGTGGSGIPSAIIAFRTSRPTLRERCVSLKVAAGKFILTALAMLVGASVGREGPTVILGSAILFALTRLPLPFFKKEYVQKGLVVAGGAAGIAVAFNAPLGGIMFAIEEHSKSFESELAKILILTIAISGFVCVQLFGRHQFFSQVFESVNIFHYMGLAILCGVVGGLLGGLFSRSLIATMNWSSLQSRSRKLALAFFSGVVVVLCGYLSLSKTYGSGFFATNLLIKGHTLPVTFFVYKMLATFASYISGISGGVFAPTIAIGAGIGNFIAMFFQHHESGVIVILALVSYFAGVTQTPITCFVIVSEMTGRHDLLFLMIIATGIAEFCSWLVCRTSLYEGLAAIQERIFLAGGHGK